MQKIFPTFEGIVTDTCAIVNIMRTTRSPIPCIKQHIKIGDFSDSLPGECGKQWESKQWAPNLKEYKRIN